MKLDFLTCLDWLFPPEAEASLVRKLSAAARDELCRPQLRGGTTILLPYQEPAVQALIHQAKFHYNQEAYAHLGALVGHYLSQTIEQPTLIIPVPLARARWRERGYNQVEEVLKQRPCRELPLGQLSSGQLYRTRNTAPQTKLKKAERKRNLEQAFALRRPAALSGQHILLVDDVYTTGSTLKAAEWAVQKAKPASLAKLAWAG